MDPIVTLTLNPALDIETEVERIEPDHKLRCAPPLRHPGGGGINVARAIRHLGGEATACYLAAGPIGEMIGMLLDAEEVERRAVPVPGNARQSLNVVERATGREFRFVLPGNDLSELDWDGIADRLAEEAAGAGWVVLSGSLPPGTPDDIWRRIAAKARRHGARIALDSSGPALARALGPDLGLIKPNLRELSGLLGRSLDGNAAIEAAVRELIGSGRAGIVAVTLGAGGACVADRDRLYWMTPPRIEPLSTVGAGDSFVAGMTLGLARGLDLREAARLAMAAAAAILLTPGTTPFTREMVDRLLPQVGAAG